MVVSLVWSQAALLLHLLVGLDVRRVRSLWCFYRQEMAMRDEDPDLSTWFTRVGDWVVRGFKSWLHSLMQIIGAEPLDPPKNEFDRRVRVALTKLGIMR